MRLKFLFFFIFLGFFVSGQELRTNPIDSISILMGKYSINQLLPEVTQAFLEMQSAAKKEGISVDSKKEASLKEKIQNEYEEKTDILYAASNLWVDAVIDPAETRSWISMGIDMANHAPSSEKFNMGVLQV